tara:strand:- start:3765 stop:4118 length:354 start_codon:yes stop_codon:yes gene_type:complete
MKVGELFLTLVSKSHLIFCQRFLLFRNDFALRCHVGIEFQEGFPFIRQIVFMEDGFDWTLGNACFAVNAFVRVDVKYFVTLVEAFHGADYHAIGVFAAKTGLGNHVRHLRPSPCSGV